MGLRIGGGELKLQNVKFGGRHSFACLLAGLCLLVALGVGAAEAKRVLIVHSFGNAAPPFTTHSVAFETELTEKIGERVDLDEVYLDVARYATLDMEEALVDLMRKRQTKWEPDLVVPIGSPAGMFVAQHRTRLFPDTTPIIYTGMDKRRLPPDALATNAAFVGESFDIRGMVDDILQVAPATTNIAVVLGASQLEKYWAEAFRQEFECYTNRLGFTWLNDLPFEQMLERVKHLPPRSFIFLILLMRDASGVTHNADEALKHIHAGANAPVNSIFQHQMGLGIVGGRLYQAEHEGIESARIAVRVLHGEPVSRFPPQIIGPLGPCYDWRELQRWNLSEANLPAGSEVLFRQPTTWQRYRTWIITGVSVCAGQAALIFALLGNLRRRRRAELSLLEGRNRLQEAEQAAREFSGRLLQAQEAERSRLARELHDDITQRLARLSIDAARATAGNESERGERMRELQAGLAGVSDDVHSLSYRLHPALLEDLGLAEALKAECERFSRQESIPVAVNVEEVAKAGGPGLCLFRVAQEALRNVGRHARADSVRVSLRSLDGGLQLVVSDTGAGFELARQGRRPSLGLASMRERVRLSNGDLDIESSPGEGTTVIAWVPLKEKDA